MGGRSSGWPEKSVSNVLDVLPGWRCRASCTMTGLSQTKRFQPGAVGGVGNAEPPRLWPAEGHKAVVSMQTPLLNPILPLLSREVLPSCSFYASALLKVFCSYCPTSTKWVLEEDLGKKAAFPGVTVCRFLEMWSPTCLIVLIGRFHLCPGAISKGALSTRPEVTLVVCGLDL